MESFPSCVIRLEFRILELSRIKRNGPIGGRGNLQVNLQVLTTSCAAIVSFARDGSVGQRHHGESQVS